MTNKLRIYAAALGGGLATVSLWAAVAYGGPAGPYLLAAAVGVLAAATPVATAHGKLLRERRRQAGLGESTFVSPPLEVERETFLETSAAALESAEAFVGVKRREFPEGSGLIVDHTRFHGTFVRLSGEGRAVVTGIKSDAATAVVDELEGVWQHTLSRRDSNPFLRPIPVHGLPRAFLAIALTVVIVLDAAFLVGLAYPSPAYNPGEKATLVAYDVRADVDPDVDATEAKLAKAGFLVTVLREEATEVRWQAGINDSSRSSVNDAAAISADVTRLLDAAGRADLDPAERARLDRLRAEHDRALAEVREAMREPAPNATASDFDDPFDADGTTANATSSAATSSIALPSVPTPSVAPSPPASFGGRRFDARVVRRIAP